jgi:hypothetical protein
MADALNCNRFLVSLVLQANAAQRPMLGFGAGVGTFARALSQHRLSVDCVEPDSAQADAIARAGFRVSRKIEAVPSESYDFIYSFNLLEDIEDDR